MTWPLIRGQVIQANIGLDEPKLLLVVSNNQRNRNMRSVICVRLTTTAKPDLPSVVELGHTEVFVGRVVCDDVIEVFDDELVGIRGGLTAPAMSRVDEGLRAALGLRP